MSQDEQDIMAAYTVVFDGLAHLGPGDAAITRGLVERLRPSLPATPRVADLGSGVGASALVLAEALPEARVLALDAHAPFVARLRHEAGLRGLAGRIEAVVGDMAEPPPLDGVPGELDLIWSESAIYALGRSEALSAWVPLLRPGGWLGFSDIVWRRDAGHRSAEASAFWNAEYPQLTTTDAVLAELVAAGLQPQGPVIGDRRAWSNYYEPLRTRLQSLTAEAGQPRALAELIAGIQREIAVYDRCGEEVALAYFLARRATNRN